MADDNTLSGEHGEPSLVRLKNLKNIKDVQDQLDEATFLCNHAHRADMILRWLLDAIKNNADLRSKPQAWKLLEGCARLLVPSRLAILFKQSGLLLSITQALAPTSSAQVKHETSSRIASGAKSRAQDSPALINAIHGLLAMLLTILNSRKGKCLLPVLTADSELAARFLGSWALVVYDYSRDASMATQQWSEILAPALEIWELHQGGSSERQAFIKHAWFSCSLLLTSANFIAQDTGSHKRARDFHGPIEGAVERLEQLIARQVFLDARSSFFNSSSTDSLPSESGESESDRMNKIVFRAETLSRHIRDSQKTEAALKVVPSQLNIAIRCAPITEHRHKPKELEWNDAVFLQLRHHCCLKLEDQMPAKALIVDLLEVARRRLGLSSKVLLDVLVQDAFTSTDGVHHWNIIEKVMEMNGEVFLAESIVEKVILALSHSPESRASSLPPIVRAFAVNRRLPEFLKAWQSHVSTVDQQRSNKTLSPLSTTALALEVSLNGLIEEHMTTEQIRDELDSRLQALDKLPEDDLQMQTTLRGITLLCSAILRACTRSSTRAAIAVIAFKLFLKLKDIHAQYSEQNVNKQLNIVGFWSTMNQSIAVWFPEQAVKDSADASKILSDSTFALDTATGADISIIQDKKVSQDDDFMWFCGLACSILRQYAEHRMVATRLIEKVLRQNAHAYFDIIAVFPDLFDLLSNVDQSTLLFNEDNADLVNGAASDLAQVLIVTSRSSQHGMISSIVDESMRIISQTPAGTNHEQQCLQSMKNLLCLPLAAMGKTVRDSLLNQLSDPNLLSNVTPTLHCARLAMLLRLIPTAASNAGIFESVDAIWKLHRGLELQHLEVGKLDEISSLSKELVASALERLLSGFDRQRSQSVLDHFLDKAQAITLACSKHQLTPASMIDLNIAIAVLVRSSPISRAANVRSRLPDAWEDCRRALKGLIKQAKQISSGFLKAGFCNDGMALTIILDAAATVGETGDIDAETWSKLLDEETTIQILSSSSLSHDVGKTTRARCLRSPQAQMFRLMCVRSTYTAIFLAHTAVKLLDTPMSPIDRSVVFQTFETVLRTKAGNMTTTILDSIVPNDLTNVSASALVIARKAFSLIDKEDVMTDVHEYRSILFKMINLLMSNASYKVKIAALISLTELLRLKPYIMNQHAIEQMLNAIYKLATPSPAEKLLFARMCELLTALLTTQRTKLNDRFHILVAALQAMLLRLLAPADKTREAEIYMLRPAHAQRFTRVLTLLCDAPQAGRRKPSSTGEQTLVDEVRRARARVGCFVGILLHSYCTLVLRSPPRDGFREALLPALWSMLETMEVHDTNSIKVLSAAMNNNERAILRSVVDEWRRVAKWRGT